MKHLILLTYVATARDGGTIKYVDRNGISYWEDYRIGTNTPGAIYVCYPDDNPTHIVPLETWKLFAFTKYSNYYHKKAKENGQ